jgi:hypothetical protein
MCDVSHQTSEGFHHTKRFMHNLHMNHKHLSCKLITRWESLRFWQVEVRHDGNCLRSTSSLSDRSSQLSDMLSWHCLHPHRLPYSTHRSVPNTLGLLRLYGKKNKTKENNNKTKHTGFDSTCAHVNILIKREQLSNDYNSIFNF